MNNKLRDLLGRVCAQLNIRAEYDPTYRETEMPVNAEAKLLNELRRMLDDPAALWTALAEGTHESGIRYIGASGSHILGDVFYGRGGLTVGRMGEEGYGERQMVECWRYSASREQVEGHLPLTHWQELPDSPVPPKTYEPFIFSDSPDGAAAEAVYLRQVAAEDKFNGQ